MHKEEIYPASCVFRPRTKTQVTFQKALKPEALVTQMALPSPPHKTSQRVSIAMLSLWLC